MKQMLTLAACLIVGAAVLPAKALMIAPPPVGQRIATAEAVVVGKVIKFTDKMVPAEMFKGDMRQMQIAIVKVDETLMGGKVKEIKVGFFPPMAVAPGGGIRIRPRPSVQLEVGIEALLMLQAHPTKKDVLVVNDFFSVIRKKDNPNFAKELAEVKKSAKLLADPKKGLKSKDAEERFLTTALLIARYKTPRTPDAKQETATAEESKLILTNLAEANWNSMGGRGFQTTPMALFYRLGVTAKDGWTPKPGVNMQEQAKAWLKANAGKYKIVRYARPKTDTTTDPEP